MGTVATPCDQLTVLGMVALLSLLLIVTELVKSVTGWPALFKAVIIKFTGLPALAVLLAAVTLKRVTTLGLATLAKAAAVAQLPCEAVVGAYSAASQT